MKVIPEEETQELKGAQQKLWEGKPEWELVWMGIRGNKEVRDLCAHPHPRGATCL